MRNELIAGNFSNSTPNTLIGFVTAGTPAYIAVNNGLSMVGSAIQLGGTQTGDVTITSGAFNFLLQGTTGDISLIRAGAGNILINTSAGAISIGQSTTASISLYSDVVTLPAVPPTATAGSILMRDPTIGQVKAVGLGSGLSIIAGNLVSSGGGGIDNSDYNNVFLFIGA